MSSPNIVHKSLSLSPKPKNKTNKKNFRKLILHFSRKVKGEHTHTLGWRITISVFFIVPPLEPELCATHTISRGERFACVLTRTTITFNSFSDLTNFIYFKEILLCACVRFLSHLCGLASTHTNTRNHPAQYKIRPYSLAQHFEHRTYLYQVLYTRTYMAISFSYLCVSHKSHHPPWLHTQQTLPPRTAATLNTSSDIFSRYIYILFRV